MAISFKGFIRGFFAAIVLFMMLSIPALAKTAEENFSLLNVKINGKMTVMAGETYIFHNGRYVACTTYHPDTSALPLSKGIGYDPFIKQIKNYPVTACNSKGKDSAGGIALTFDDHYVISWYSARELFKKYGARVTFFVDKYLEFNANELNLLKELKNDGHEIAGHGLYHLDAPQFVKEKSIDAYISEEIDSLIEVMAIDGFELTAFAYPGGARTKELYEALLKKFRIIRGTVYTGNKTALKNLDSAYYKPGNGNWLVFGVGIDGIYGNTVESILEGLERANRNGEVLVLYAHRIGESENENSYIVSMDKLEMILRYATHTNMKFYTISELAD